MRIADLKCRDSYSPSAPDCRGQESLFLGPRRPICFFFNLPPSDFSFCMLRKASLILFKLPYISSCRIQEAASPAGRYALYPLLDFFSAFSDLFCPPAADPARRVDFEDDRRRGYTEIDITPIVRDWASGKLENRGLLLTGTPGSPSLYYASHRYRIPGMRPLIRLKCEAAEFSRALQVVPCEVTVSRRTVPPAEKTGER